MKKHRFNIKDLKKGKPGGPAKPFPTANPKSRPDHKAEVLRVMKRDELDKARPEPMGLMRKREKEIPSDLAAELSVRRCGKVYCPPEVTAGVIEQTAKVVAAWDNSDPFAYGRTALHVRRGLIISRDLVKEMSQRTLARQAAKRKEVDDAKSHA